MNIWEWVNRTIDELAGEGQLRLAYLINAIPDHCTDDRHEQVDALVPEALALAEAAKRPWLDVYFRHWHLQSRVFHRMDGTALPEAVRLLERAHRDDVRGCPQAVCATQDLAATYGQVDGPGYAAERMAVAAETLSRIDARWPCFTCIASEYADALADAGDAAGALAYCEARIADLVKVGEDDAHAEFVHTRVDALLALGRAAEALALLDDTAEHARDEDHDRLRRRLGRARALAALGRLEEASEALPGLDEIARNPPFYADWTEVVGRLVDAGLRPNDAALGRALAGFVARLEAQGIGRTTLALAERHGRLALGRGAVGLAARAVQAMERALPRLGAPLDAPARVAALRVEVEAARAAQVAALGDDVDALLARLDVAPSGGEAPGGAAALDPELALGLLDAAAARWPEDARVRDRLADTLRALGLAEEAAVAARGAYDLDPSDERLLGLGDALLAARRDADLEALCAAHRARTDDARARALADWLLARLRFAGGDYERCEAHLAEVLAARPDAVPARLLWARSAWLRRDWETMLARLDEVVARNEGEPGPYDWDRMIAASILGRWRIVRQSAARLGEACDPASDAPIDETWELCALRFDGSEGEVPGDRVCRRTGPVTARILGIGRDRVHPAFGDVYVFDARPVDPVPENPEERRRTLTVFTPVARVRDGGFRSFFLDGEHPGADAVSALERLAVEAGGELQVRSEEGDVLHWPERGEVPRFFAALAVPEGADLAALDAALAAAVGAAQTTWPELAREAGALERAEAHARIEALLYEG
jgi:tetratricopeptide (TPR) repeat protein